jgi:hypothetical protein
MTLDATAHTYDTPVGQVDINTSDEIRPQQTSELRSVVNRFSSLFEDEEPGAERGNGSGKGFVGAFGESSARTRSRKYFFIAILFCISP